MGRQYPDYFTFEVTPLSPEETGLSVHIYVDGNGAGTAPRPWKPQIYVVHYGTGIFDGEGELISQGEEGFTILDFAVSVSNDPQVVYGRSNVSDDNLRKIFQWVKINKDNLLVCWNGNRENLEVSTMKKV